MFGLSTVKLIALGVLVLAIISAIGAGAHFLYQAGRDACKAERGEQIEAVAKALEESDKQTARAIAGIDIKHITINRRITNATRTDIVYRDCRHSPGVFDDLNRSLTGSDRAAGTGVPAASAPAR